MLLGLQVEEAHHADYGVRAADRGAGVQRGWVETGDCVFLLVREWEEGVMEEERCEE